MAFLKERVRRLEEDVDTLKNWSGPGQAAALSDSVRELRAEFKVMQKTQRAMQSTLDQHTETLDQHTRILDQHTETLGEIKSAIAEILDRLPPKPTDPSSN